MIDMEDKKKKQGKKFTVEHFRKNAALRPYQSMLEVRDKEDGFAYRLVENKPEAIRYRQQLGYEVVTEGVESAPGSVGQPDRRRIIAGELVLMRRQQDIHEMDVQARKERAREMQLGPIERFKGKAQRLGVKVVDETRMEVSPLSSIGAFSEDDD